MLVKICGMRRQADLDLAAELRFDFCGFIFHKGSPRYITPTEAGKLNSHSMKRVGVFVGHGVEDIRQIMAEARLDFAQLHGAQTNDDALAIGPQKVIRVIWPRRYGNIGDMQADLDLHAGSCAFFLADAGVAGGGSGECLAWSQLAHLHWRRPWLLAGGISPECICEALAQCGPDGIDANSGVEISPGVKNHSRMRSLVQNLAKRTI